MRYVGFDIGDGESAVAVYEQGSGIEPIIAPVCGARSLISAVGLKNGEIVVGGQAYASSLADELSVRFKSRFTDDPRSYEPIVRFVKGVLGALRDAGTLREDDAFIVGCPAGWNAACRARYRDLLIRAGLRTPAVISESRAAFLYAKYAKTVALDVDVLSQSALVVDIGSSTLDFAYIVNGRETGVGTFGDTHFGGGLLDAELLRRAVEHSRDRDRIREVFSESQSWYSYCEIAARRLKEEYFTLAADDPAASVEKRLRVCYDGVQRLTLALDAASVGALIDEPMATLHGASFAQALMDALQSAKAVTAAAPPKLVLLTGGASRMSFFQAQCREVFADALVVCCPEPEFSIAKGLAYAGWVDDNLRAFRAEIEREVTDERVGDIAREAAPELVPSVTNALVELVLKEAAIPIVTQWKRGEIDTLEQMNEQLQRRTERVLASPMAEEALAPILATWAEGLTGKLQAMIDPICDRYSVPRSEMKLSLAQTGEAGRVRIDAKQLMGLPMIGGLVGVVVSVVSALLCGGGGVALIAAGPTGMFAGAVIGALVAVIGWPGVSGAIMKAKLPRVFRLINVERQLTSDATKRRLRDALQKELSGPDSAFTRQLSRGFTDSFQRYLRGIAQAAEIPIQ